MDKILLIHGPNLNFLGKRNSEHYGNLNLNNLVDLIKKEARQYHFEIIDYQSNFEGELIDKIQREAHRCLGMIINPGAFSHYSYSLYDALIDSNLPVIEVHLSDIYEREDWRKISVTKAACIKMICGKKEQGYMDALKILKEHLYVGQE